VNAWREAGAQFGLEARARAAVLGTAEEIRADDVPPTPAWAPASAGTSADGCESEPVTGGPLPQPSGYRWRRWSLVALEGFL
jgi:hypothetical protein